MSEAQKLWSVSQASYRALRQFRENRQETIREFVGKHYSEEGTKDKRPINLLYMALTIYQRQLLTGLPQWNVTARYPGDEPEAMSFQLGLNAYAEKLKLFDVLTEFVGDALFGMGIVKMGVEMGDKTELLGDAVSYGEPYVQVVDLDDFVFDMDARRWEEVSFVGERIRLPLEYVRANFDNTSGLRGDRRSFSDWDTNGGDRLFNLSRGTDALAERELEDHLDVWRFWLRRNSKIIYLAPQSDTELVLGEEDWDGPDEGGYRVLRFTRVPGQILPLPVTAILRDLHELVNDLYLKLGRQALRQKTTVAYRPSAAEDAANLRDGEDGELLRTDDPAGIQERRWGGPDNVNLAFAIHSMDQFDELAGNLKLLGGLGPSAGTLGQERILAARSSELMQHLYGHVSRAIGTVGYDLGYWLYTDPLLTVPITKGVEGVDETLTVNWGPEDRLLEFIRFKFELDVHTLRNRTPEERLSEFTQVWQTYVLPLLPELERMGGVLDVERVLAMVGEYSGMPELSRMVVFTQSLQPPAGSSAAPRQSPHTVRENVRTNRSEQPASSRNAELVGNLLAGSGGGYGS